MVAFAPDRVVRGDAQPQARVRDLVRRGARRPRAPGRQVVRHPDVGVEGRAVELVGEHGDAPGRSR